MTEILARKRPSSLASGLALLLFLAVYVSALVVSLAPRGTFSTSPSSMAATED